MLSASGVLKRTSAILVAAGIAGGVIYFYFASRLPSIPHRPLRIGFEPNPPFQIRADTDFGGLAIETINAAARRTGVRLEWVETGTSSDEAFQKGLVDLWPLMADLPERRRRLHLSEPWVISSHILLLREGSTTPVRSFSGRIALFKMPIHVRLLRAEFPQFQPAPFADAREVVRAVCRGNVAAGFLEKRVAMTALKEMPPECASTSLRVQNIPELTLKNCVASTFEAAGAAELLRREIGNLYRDGDLAAPMAKYSFYGLDDAWATYHLMEAVERSRWIAWGTAVFAVAVTLALWHSFSLRQRKRTEKMLRESEERFRAIFQQAGVGVAQVSLKGKIEMANDRYCEVVGYSPEDLLEKGTREFTIRDDLNREMAMLPRLLAGEIQSFSTEKRYARKDGTIIWATVCRSLVRDGQGKAKCFITVVEDITERKQAEAALRESEERFRNMADSAPVLIWVAGPDKLFTFLNKTWLDFTGRAMEQEVCNGWTGDVHPDDLDVCYQRYCSSFDARETFHTECRLRRADGECRWILFSGVPRYERGAFAGYIGSGVDMTDIRRAQQEAFERQNLESLGVLTGGIAHDFNNLLGGVLASAEFLLAEHAAGASLDEQELVRIKTAAIRGGEIVRQLMVYAGQESETIELVDVSWIVEDIIELLKVSVSKHSALEIDLGEDVPPVRANPAKLRQVLINLVTNASEAIGDRDGVIRVTTRRVSVDRDSSGALSAPLPGGDYMQLEVSDTGCGMSPQLQVRAFGPFFTTKSAGRGLGLAVVRGIVHSLHGAIRLTSAPGKGTSFQILLPCVETVLETTRDSITRAQEITPESGHGTILIVEDEDQLRQAVSKMIRKLGYSVIEASDGSAALDAMRAQENSIGVLFLDVTLPGTPSHEVLEEGRRLRPNMSVIVTSAYSEQMAAASLGRVERFIRKPYRLSEVVDLVRKTL